INIAVRTRLTPGNGAKYGKLLEAIAAADFGQFRFWQRQSGGDGHGLYLLCDSSTPGQRSWNTEAHGMTRKNHKGTKDTKRCRCTAPSLCSLCLCGFFPCFSVSGFLPCPSVFQKPLQQPRGILREVRQNHLRPGPPDRGERLHHGALAVQP